jgi:hypothetical protein
MTRDAKRKTLAFLLGVMILTAVLGTALPRLELKPGLPLPWQATTLEGGLPDPDQPLLAISIDVFWKAVMGILLVAGLAYNVYRLLKEAAWHWQDIVRSLLYLLIPVVVLLGLLLILSGSRLTIEAPPPDIPPPIVEVKGPPLGAVPSFLIWLVCLGLAAVLIGLGLWLVFRKSASPDLVRQEAERALEALQTGLDLRNVILRCYSQMTQVLQQEQGLEMETAMTAREFQRLLEKRGVPPAPVQQLTRLFEAARYGHRPPGPSDEREAVDCLTAIVHYSQAGRRGQ